MGSKDRNNLDLAQQFECGLQINSRLAQAAQSAADGTWLWRAFGRELGSPATALAMIRFCEICKFEVNGECLSHAIGLDQFHVGDYQRDTFHQLMLARALSVLTCIMLQLTVFDGKLPNFFDRMEKGLPRLFFQYLTQQTTE